VAAATRTERIIAAAAISVVVAGCGGGGGAGTASVSRAERQTLRSYVARIEPLRLGVNKLLYGAGPLLGGYREQRLSAAAAQRGMRRLERRFAAYEARVAAVQPVPPDLVAAQHAYAHTYVLEDAYLRALTAALPMRDWASLPHFESRQRRAIVAWRAAVALEAARVGVPVPSDLAVAGGGEMAPSPLEDE
jgi:hypothetical protein